MARAPVTLPPDFRARLVAAADAARRNNEVFDATDGANRKWFVGPEVVENRSVVLISVTRGPDTAGQTLSTATFTPEAADAAVSHLDGALQ